MQCLRGTTVRLMRKRRLLALVYAAVYERLVQVDCYVWFTCDSCDVGESVRCHCLYWILMLLMSSELLVMDSPLCAVAM